MITAGRVRSTAIRVLGWPAAAAILIAGAVLSAGCSSSSAQDTPVTVTSPTERAVPTGQQIFASNCAACHGANGEGQPDWHIEKADGTLPAPPLNGDGHTWHHGDGLLYRIISQGGAIPEMPSYKSGMPAFGDHLSRQEIIDVLTYIKSLWGDKTKRGLSIRESQALVSERDPFPMEEE